MNENTPPDHHRPENVKAMLWIIGASVVFLAVVILVGM